MTLRRVDIGDQRLDEPDPGVPPPDPGVLPELTWVEIAALRIDDAFQRPLGNSNWRAIRRIAATFRWALFQPVIVARLDARRFTLIDGQHRAHAALLAGHLRVPAMIIDVPVTDQARAFVGINAQRTNLTAGHILRAALAAGEPWAIASDGAVRAAGCRLMVSNYSATQRKPRDVFAVALVRDLVRAGKARLVTAGLTALSGAPQAEDRNLWREAILRSWFEAVEAAGTPPVPILAGFLQQADLLVLRDKALKLKRDPRCAGMSDRALITQSYRTMLQAYLLQTEAG